MEGDSEIQERARIDPEIARQYETKLIVDNVLRGLPPYSGKTMKDLDAYRRLTGLER